MLSILLIMFGIPLLVAFVVSIPVMMFAALYHFIQWLVRDL